MPSEFYRRVISGEGVIKLNSRDDTASFTATRDNIVITERTASIGEDLSGIETIVKRATHIIPGTLSFMNNPKARFLGMVWQYVDKRKRERERFSHPVAQTTSQALLRFALKQGEYPAEANARLAFRKRLPSSYLVRGQDDFLNIILSIGDVPINDIWPEAEEAKPRTQVTDDTRLGILNIDIQIFFDPRRRVTEKAIEAHWNECQRMMNRVAELLKGVGVEAE